ncbi:MAG: S-type pyocin family protein [Phenylobacterium sp.]|uniref:S-type pyocin family protein n=1 Tax=Brevundimonas sp. TaxID=1871086 RepID=UPI0027379BF0|nr:S-type pyocin family protein [Brevundimonas sp.]MDP3802837.1 S-type pyocin family protein [Brevundimonas sp.]MDZ4375642.1 S-type pyocin family protein [Phenylobacterium sp.]
MIANKGPVWMAAASLGLALALAGCGDGGSAVETRDRAAEGAETTPTAASGAASETVGAAREEARPAITANRRETVDAKITRLFERNGADFGASTPQDYLAKIRSFTARPPAGTDRVERPNGDVLLYQASTNTFAVVSRDGAPRTMFKPRDGAAYWAEQKARAPTFGQARSTKE